MTSILLPDTIDDVPALPAGVRALRGHPLFRKIVDVDPELLLPYVLDRRGASQDALLELITDAVRRGHADGSIRPGHPVRQARTLLLMGVDDIDRETFANSMSIIVKHRTDIDLVAERVGLKLPERA